MSYPDFPIIADQEYIPAKEMLDFLDKYKKHFNLEKHIKVMKNAIILAFIHTSSFNVKYAKLRYNF